MFASVPLFTEDLYLRVRANALCSLLSYITDQPRQQVTSSEGATALSQDEISSASSKDTNPSKVVRDRRNCTNTVFGARSWDTWNRQSCGDLCERTPGHGPLHLCIGWRIDLTQESLPKPSREGCVLSNIHLHCRIGGSLMGWHPGNPVTWSLGYPHTLLLLTSLWSYRNILRVLPAVSDGAPLAWGTQADILLNQGGVWERNPSEK